MMGPWHSGGSWPLVGVADFGEATCRRFLSLWLLLFCSSSLISGSFFCVCVCFVGFHSLTCVVVVVVDVGGTFELKMDFPDDYPEAPPVLRFVSDVWHPNIYPGERQRTIVL